MAAPAHIGWLKSGENIVTSEGVEVEVWDLDHQLDDAILSAWAKHFRQHYCKDEDLADAIEGTIHTRASYLVSVKFPDSVTPSGPSTRAGDFGEILLADFAEFVLGYWCPREGRYENRDNRNVPSNGCDVVAFKFHGDDEAHPEDELLIIESKAGLRATKENRLQKAVEDSIKDLAREAMSLNAIKQRLNRVDRLAAKRVQRFQNYNDRPFRRVNAAGAVLDIEVFNSVDFTSTLAKHHPNIDNLKLLVIRGASMMDLVHTLYDRAADEA